MARNSKRTLGLVLAAACAVALLALGTGCAKHDAGTLVPFDGGGATYQGHEVRVQLDENLTTGYVWTASLEGSGLELTLDESASSGDSAADGKSGQGQMAGQGGVHLFAYRGVSAGTSIVTMAYARPWEQGAAEKTVVLSVRTASDGTIESVDVQA